MRCLLQLLLDLKACGYIWINFYKRAAVSSHKYISIHTKKKNTFTHIILRDGTCLNVNNKLKVLQWDTEFGGDCLVGGQSGVDRSDWVVDVKSRTTTQITWSTWRLTAAGWWRKNGGWSAIGVYRYVQVKKDSEADGVQRGVTALTVLPVQCKNSSERQSRWVYSSISLFGFF